MKNSLAMLLSALSLTGLVWPQTASEILQKMDANLYSDTKVIKAAMTVHGRRGSRTIAFQSWVQGSQRSFTEYLSPAQEQGTKMLKLGSRLWLYSPAADRVIQISGHLLRQSVLGSDLSYEDMMEDRRLSEIYEAEFLGQDTLQGRSVWILNLRAKVPDAAYHSQKIWIDKERSVPLRQELYAKSGQRLKLVEVRRVEMVQGRWYPLSVFYQDVLKQGGGTEFNIAEIFFDRRIAEHIFSKASLRK